MKLIKLDFSDKNISNVAQFMKENSADFNPPFSERVDIDTYAEKLLLVAEVVVLIDSNFDIGGLISFYANDNVNHESYISYLSVGEKFRQRGFSKKLLDVAISICKENKMSSIEVQTWTDNEKGIKLYQSFGFEKQKIVDDKLGSEVERLVLKKWLN